MRLRTTRYNRAVAEEYNFLLPASIFPHLSQTINKKSGQYQSNFYICMGWGRTLGSPLENSSKLKNIITQNKEK